MYVLDFIMYFVLGFVVWKILAIISGDQYTEELGGMTVGLLVLIVYTIIYIYIFWSPTTNWSDFDYSQIKLCFKW